MHLYYLAFFSDCQHLTVMMKKTIQNFNKHPNISTFKVSLANRSETLSELIEIVFMTIIKHAHEMTRAFDTSWKTKN